MAHYRLRLYHLHRGLLNDHFLRLDRGDGDLLLNRIAVDDSEGVLMLRIIR